MNPTAPNTPPARRFRLVECGVCDGHGFTIRTDWSSTEFPPPRKTAACWCCKGLGKHPALPDDYKDWLATLNLPEQPDPIAQVS